MAGFCQGFVAFLRLPLNYATFIIFRPIHDSVVLLFNWDLKFSCFFPCATSDTVGCRQIVSIIRQRLASLLWNYVQIKEETLLTRNHGVLIVTVAYECTYSVLKKRNLTQAPDGITDLIFMRKCHRYILLTIYEMTRWQSDLFKTTGKKYNKTEQLAIIMNTDMPQIR